MPVISAVASHLVARPFADHRAGDVADVVLIEAQQRAEARFGERRTRACEPVSCSRRKSTRSSKSTCLWPGACSGRSQRWRGSISSGLMMRGSTRLFSWPSQRPSPSQRGGEAAAAHFALAICAMSTYFAGSVNVFGGSAYVLRIVRGVTAATACAKNRCDRPSVCALAAAGLRAGATV